MKNSLIVFTILLVLSACQDSSIPETKNDVPEVQLKPSIPEAIINYRNSAKGRSDISIKEILNETVFANSNIRVSEVHEYKFETATTVETVDRQFESTLPSRWVPGDPNRDWNGDGDLDDIDWVSFTPFALANGTIDAEPVYRDMYELWESDGNCKNVVIDEMPYDFSMGNPSLIIDFGIPSTGLPIADISIVGFLPAEIFEDVLGAENILGVAFSFVFIDENGNPIKTTRGKEDKAYSEVWFNDGFSWAFGPKPGSIDIESVVLHEGGHTLNLGHFGILQRFSFRDGASRLVYRPVNTMNAIYIGEPRNFLGQNDKGNFCEAWGSWPYN